MVCYEIKHGIILHKHRKKINQKCSIRKVSRRNSIKTRDEVCSICQSESLIINKSGKKICKNCSKTTKSYIKQKIKEASGETKQKTKDGIPICSNCHLEMVRRKGRFGTFWGCPKYPACKITYNIT